MDRYKRRHDTHRGHRLVLKLVLVEGVCGHLVEADEGLVRVLHQEVLALQPGSGWCKSAAYTESDTCAFYDRTIAHNRLE